MGSPAFIGFLAFIFIGMSLVNRLLEGAFITSADLSVVNQLTVFTDLEVFGLFSLPIPNLSFITEGLPNLINFNYSFFGGSGAFFQYFLYSATAALSFFLFIAVVVSIASNYLNRR